MNQSKSKYFTFVKNVGMFLWSTYFVFAFIASDDAYGAGSLNPVMNKYWSLVHAAQLEAKEYVKDRYTVKASVTSSFVPHWSIELRKLGDPTEGGTIYFKKQRASNGPDIFVDWENENRSSYSFWGDVAKETFASKMNEKETVEVVEAILRAGHVSDSIQLMDIAMFFLNQMEPTKAKNIYSEIFEGRWAVVESYTGVDEKGKKCNVEVTRSEKGRVSNIVIANESTRVFSLFFLFNLIPVPTMSQECTTLELVPDNTIYGEDTQSAWRFVKDNTVKGLSYARTSIKESGSGAVQGTLKAGIASMGAQQTYLHCERSTIRLCRNQVHARSLGMSQIMMGIPVGVLSGFSKQCKELKFVGSEVVP